MSHVGEPQYLRAWAWHDRTSGYITRATRFPVAGNIAPRRYYHDYLRILASYLAAAFDRNPKYSTL